jgi:hypothetical protein
MDFYQGYEDLIEFSSATVENAFGSQLLALCERKFENIEDAVAVLTEGLDELGFEVDEEGVVGLMTGEVLPSEDVLEALAGLADTDADVQRLYNSASTAYEVAATLLEDGEIEVDEDEDYEDVYEASDEDDMDTVEESDEDEDEEAELVAQMYSRQVVTDYLNDYVEVADQMMQGGQGLMTPQIKELLFGQSDKNRYMNFSAAVEQNGYTPEEYLKCIEFSLNLLSELGGIDSNYFESQIEEDMSGSNVNFSRQDSSAVETEARQMLEWLNL